MPASRCILGFIALSLSGLATAGQLRIDRVRIAAHDDHTRVALGLTSPAQHKIFTLSNPHRVVVDIAPGRLSSAARPLPKGVGPVRGIRGANRDDGSVRIVLDLNAPVQPRSFLLAADGTKQDRLVIDLRPLGQPAPAVKPREALSGARDLVIAIDPGHGGKDPGARGPSGLREKDVVLRISRKLAEVIDSEPGMRSMLTRRGDQFVHLRDRMERARAARADLFLSVHADAFRDRKVRGATVYVLSEKGATDEAARRLAERENGADLIGGVRLAEKDPTLASVLLDLSQNASLSASFDVGEEILQELGRLTRLRKRHVQEAPFLVLKSPDVPSVLLETAFISNRTDEKNLGSRRYQQDLAVAVLDGIRNYFYANPPPGTRVAELRRAGYRARAQHVIQRGDTLSEIAARYRVSIRRIRALNDLPGDKIKVGQVLRIPPGPQEI